MARSQPSGCGERKGRKIFPAKPQAEPLELTSAGALIE